MTVLTAAIGNAMCTQVERVNAQRKLGDGDPARLKEHIADLEATIGRLKEQIERQRQTILDFQAARDNPTTHNFMQHNGRPVGSQSDLARHLGVKPYTISRANTAGKLEKFTADNGKTYFYLNQPLPPRKPRARK